MRLFCDVAFAIVCLLLNTSLAAAPASNEKQKDMTFLLVDTGSRCANCSVVQASGAISERTIKDYYDFIGRARFGKHVYFVFDSPGGSMSQALSLGGIMRTLKVNTVVGRAVVRNGEVEIEPGICASACVMAYIGGATRSIPKGSRLGVHSWMPADIATRGSRTGNRPRLLDKQSIEQVQRLAAVFMMYTDSMGVDLRMIMHAMRTPYENIFWIEPRNLSLWRVVTIDSSLSTVADRRWPVLFLPGPDPLEPSPAANPPAEPAARRLSGRDAAL